MLDATQEVADQWRSSANSDNPAGPLFVSGQFAEADITGATQIFSEDLFCGSGYCGSICTGSAIAYCC
ncbi:DUF6229 family protein [Dyella subtropica]|uniref:DUF6229 family protein n=1 Tax=Dyella subtropica TaxID=2992127 RepID=UPI00225591DC|nr:DUF6229 family protein [Dyella subtropica]